MSDFLTEKRNEIEARLEELRPLVEEADRLQQALAALDGATTRLAAARRGPGSGRRPGRPRGSGTRATQALDIVRSRPGITIPELATEMGIHQNYLYRVMPNLQQDGKIRKEGMGWYITQNQQNWSTPATAEQHSA